MKKFKKAYIIMGAISGSGKFKTYQNAYEKEEEAKKCLQDMGCEYQSPFWKKDNMIYMTQEIHIYKEF